MSSRPSILVVDDQEFIRQGIRSLLSVRPDLDCCGEAVDGLDAIEKTRKLRPNIVLMDISMPRMDGLEAARVIRSELPETKVILVSQNDPVLVRLQAEEVEAVSYVGKTTLERDLIPAIDGILGHDRPELPDKRDGGTQTTSTSRKGDRQVSEVMRSLDWSTTPLGPVDSWPPALRMMMGFLLANRFPQLLWWGPQFCCLYNDAYSPILGEKHPWAIGRPVSEVWHEIWHVLKPLIETPFQGGPATWMEDIELLLNRRGFMEETHFTVAYSPVPDETVEGGIGGVLATVHEITEKVIGERRIAALRELGVEAAESRSAEDACANAARILARHAKDVPFVLLYLFDPKGHSQRLAGSAGVEASEFLSLWEPDDQSLSAGEAWPVPRMIETEKIDLIEDLRSKFKQLPQIAGSEPATTAAIVPIRSNLATNWPDL